ncbi:MAG: hypothetical protein FJ225_00100 [Lentisphaerae bacterium]|nr:hypothetical protein [Lentisphaerota bacterium]
MSPSPDQENEPRIAGAGAPEADGEAQAATHVGHILPAALRVSARKGFGLVDALQPTVIKAIESSARSDPSRLAEALRPIFGIGIRRWITGGLSGVAQGINLVVFSVFTLRGWKWRFESMRTGRSFPEVVRRHTATWPVKQVLLVHRRTGLLLVEVRSPAFATRDADMVSGMLTAIQDFVNDSFSSGRAVEGDLETVEMGDMTVWVERGPAATIAAVLDGKAPPDLRPAFSEALTRIHGRLARELEEFDGDAAAFERSKPYLEAFLDLRTPGRSMRILPLTWLLLLAPVALLGWWGFDFGRRAYLWNSYVDTLKSQPGIMVTDVGRVDGKFYVSGLRDPLASDPAAVLAGSGMGGPDVVMHWEPYQALHPDFIKARARAILNAPSTVSMDLEHGILYLGGTAPAAWIAQAGNAARGVAGVSGIDTSALRDEYADRLPQWRKYLDMLNASPGIVVVEHGMRDGKFHVSGLNDPLARSPAKILQECGLDARDVVANWMPYQALHPDILAERARQMLLPPETVRISFQDGVLELRGEAGHEWVTRATALAAALPGVSRVVSSDLVDRELRAIAEISAAINGEVFRFLKDSPDLWPGQKGRVEGLAANIRELLRTGNRVGQRFAVEIVGHTAATDSEKTDLQIGRALAARVQDVLAMQGLDAAVFSTRVERVPPAGAGAQGEPGEKANFVSLRVIRPE